MSLGIFFGLITGIIEKMLPGRIIAIGLRSSMTTGSPALASKTEEDASKLPFGLRKIISPMIHPLSGELS
ncbi:MAG: hypothetical protein PHQ42_05340 [Patescibacteria group bacterium]|nr:hypothetical protein [Patescibacteria group bacterium]